MYQSILNLTALYRGGLQDLGRISPKDKMGEKTKTGFSN